MAEIAKPQAISMANIDTSNGGEAAADDGKGDGPSMTPIIVLTVLFPVILIAAAVTWRFGCKPRRTEERRSEEQRTTSQPQEDTDVELEALPVYSKDPPPPPPAYRPSTAITGEDELNREDQH